jgi:hypothetical protein
MRKTLLNTINQESSGMKQIDEPRLETDLGYRFEYLCDFMGFGSPDIDAIHASAEYLAPLVPQLVDAVYDKLFSYDSTKRHFVPRQSGYEGSVPEDLNSLELDHEMIEFRKQHLGRYLTRLVSDPYDEKLVSYLDAVGRIHTPELGSDNLDVPLVQMNALLGFVSDALLGTILDLNLEDAVKKTTLRAFNKLLWLQNDLVTRHYQKT